LEVVSPRPRAALLDEFYNQPGYAAHSDTDADDQLMIAQARAAALGPWSAGVRVLDIGCGNGLQLRAFHQWGAVCVGMEPSVQGRCVVEARGFSVYASLDEVQRQEPPFDLITLYHVLEHVPDLNGMFSSIGRLLKPSGRLCVEVPNLHSLRARLFSLLPPAWARDDDRYRAFPIHLYGFSAASLKTMLARYGWAPRAVMTTGLGIGGARKSEVRVDDEPTNAAGDPPSPRCYGGAGSRCYNAEGGAEHRLLHPNERTLHRPLWRRVARTIWRQLERLGLGENLTVVAVNANRR